MDTKVTWHDDLHFTGVADSGHSITLDGDPSVGGTDLGSRPLELMLMSLAGCTAMDVISILRKKRQDVTEFEVKTHAERSATHPKVFTAVFVEYIVTGHNIDPKAVERAIDLSENAYCPAQAMLVKSIPIQHTYTIIEA
jgi:putative redox protein